MTEFVAYYRVSTQRQGATGLGMEAQRTAVQAHVRGVRGHLIGEFEEVESGATSARPRLQQSIALARSRKAVLVIAKLDRLARNVQFISQIMDSGIEFVAADLPHANRLTIHIIAAVAEYEREMVSKRTREALAAARLRGIQLGNPRAATQAGMASDVAARNADAFAHSVLAHIKVLKSVGTTSYTAIARALNNQGVPTQRRKTWTAAGVKNTIARLEKIGSL